MITLDVGSAVVVYQGITHTLTCTHTIHQKWQIQNIDINVRKERYIPGIYKQTK